MNSQLWSGEQHKGEEGEHSNLITTTQSIAMPLADEYMRYTHKLSCSMHSQLWRGEQHEGEEREIGNLITTTQCNEMSLADEWIHYTYCLSCSMHSQLWRGNQYEWRKEKKATLQQPHNTTQCHLQMNGCIILTCCHVPCIPSSEGENNMNGRRKNGNLITTRQWNAMSLADECVILTSCHVPCIPSSEGENKMRGEWRQWQLNNNHTMQRNVTCRWMDALYSLSVMFHVFPVVKRKPTWGGRRKMQLNNNHTLKHSHF